MDKELNYNIYHLGVQDYLYSKSANSVDAAVKMWIEDVTSLGHLDKISPPKVSQLSFDGFVDLCSTIDGNVVLT